MISVYDALDKSRWSIDEYNRLYFSGFFYGTITPPAEWWQPNWHLVDQFGNKFGAGHESREELIKSLPGVITIGVNRFNQSG